MFTAKQFADIPFSLTRHTEQLSEQDILARRAEIAAKNAKPHVYDLTNNAAESSTNNQSLCFYTFGCAGNASEAQQEVSALMDFIAKNPENKPKFLLILGDNFYDWGVSSPLDPMFKSNFDNIYADPTLRYIAGIPCFLVLGNHDENIHRLRIPLQEMGIERGMHQVAHSYLSDVSKDYSSTDEKVALYNQKKLDVAKLPKWNMPNRYYSIIDGNTQIFCLDSNTYVSDYLKYHAGIDINPDNQAIWLEREMANAKKAGRRVLLACHHPLYTPGSRAYESDADLYLSADQIYTAKRIFKDIGANDPYNSYFRDCLKAQNITFDAVFAAHDHNISYYNNTNHANHDYPICQITAGGGGGKTQKRKKFSDQKLMGCFLKEYGFVMVKCDNHDVKKMTFDIYATKGKYHHTYTNANCLPVITFADSTSKEDKEKIEKLFAAIRQAINRYFSFIGDLQDRNHGGFFKKNLSHGQEGIQRVHDLWAYINNHETNDIVTILSEIHRLVKWEKGFISSFISTPSEHSFITILNNLLDYAFDHKDLEKLLDECKTIQFKHQKK